MTADEIMHALRLTAMGRVNAPEQQRLCEALERLFADPMNAQPAETYDIADMAVDGAGTPRRSRKKAH